MTRYFYEDIGEGWELAIGPRTVSAKEIIDFARQFDPIDFHLDEAAAKAMKASGTMLAQNRP